MKLIKPNLMNRNIRSGAISLLLALVLLGALQFTTRGHFTDPDGFYHARSSQIISQTGPAANVNDAVSLDSGQVNSDSASAKSTTYSAKETIQSGHFPWLYYTTWNEGYANQHYLYHWLLAPFNTVETLPISVVVFAVIFIALFAATLRKYQVRFSVCWILLLLTGSADFLFRINLVKANTVSLSLLCAVVLLLYAWHRSRRKSTLLGLAAVSGIFTWTYGGFVCVPLLLIAYAVAVFTIKAVEQKSFVNALNGRLFLQSLLPALVSLTGIALGMLFHPQSHNLWDLLYDQLFRTGLGAGMDVPAGNEWLPFNIGWFFKSNLIVLGVWIASLIVFLYNSRNIFFKRQTINYQNQTLALWLQFTALGLLVLTLWHRRFVEYWIPFAVLASAMSSQPYLAKLHWQEFKVAWQHWQLKLSTMLLVTVFAAITVMNINYVYDSLHNGDSITKFQAVAIWLEQNSEAGDIVFNTQWDQFPPLFYYNTKNYYVVGLDPTFMYIRDSGKYWQWRLIADDDQSRWQSPERLRNILIADFQAKFVLIDASRNPNLASYLTGQAGFSPGFSEGNLVIFRVD